MQLERISLALRPRTGHESLDLAAAMLRHGVHAAAASSCRDVGIDQGGGRRRQRPALRARFSTCLARLARTARMTRYVKAARRIALAGG